MNKKKSINFPIIDKVDLDFKKRNIFPKKGRLSSSVDCSMLKYFKTSYLRVLGVAVVKFWVNSESPPLTLPDVIEMLVLVFDFMTIFPELSDKVAVVCVPPRPSVEVDPSFGAMEEENLVELNSHNPHASKSENMKARISFMVSNSSFTVSVRLCVIVSQFINNSDLSPEQH